MPRPRSGLNARLPPNLSLHASGQYRYVRPDTKRHVYLGRDRAKAAAAAQKANALLIPSNDLLQKIIQTEHKLSTAIDLFEREGIPTKNWKPKTEELNRQRLRRINTDLGGRVIETMTTKDCADYLREVTDSFRARAQYRSQLINVFDAALHEGWIEHNPARETRAPKAKRKRERLQLADYRALHAQAPTWLQNAMDLSLHTLLRRGDIVALRFEAIRDGHLHAIPEKTRSTTGHRLRMKITGELADVIDRCRDGVASPFLVHRLPERIASRGKQAKGRDHHTQVLEEQLTRAFRKLVVASKRWPKESAPPTFHEIRSLGADLYRQAGWSKERIQTLMGHASAEMTQQYLNGHEAPWTDTQAGHECASSEPNGDAAPHAIGTVHAFP